MEELTDALNLTDRLALLKYLVEELKDSHFVVEAWRDDIHGFRIIKEDKELECVFREEDSRWNESCLTINQKCFKSV